MEPVTQNSYTKELKKPIFDQHMTPQGDQSVGSKKKILDHFEEVSNKPTSLIECLQDDTESFFFLLGQKLDLLFSL